MCTNGKLIYTSNNRGDGVVVDVQWDSTWWFKWCGCWKYGISAGKSVVIVLGLDEDDGCIAVSVRRERWNRFPVVFGSFLETNCPAIMLN